MRSWRVSRLKTRAAHDELFAVAAVAVGATAGDEAENFDEI